MDEKIFQFARNVSHVRGLIKNHYAKTAQLTKEIEESKKKLRNEEAALPHYNTHNINLENIERSIKIIEKLTEDNKRLKSILQYEEEALQLQQRREEQLVKLLEKATKEACNTAAELLFSEYEQEEEIFDWKF